MADFKGAAIALYQARQRHKQAHEALKQYRKEHGSCDGENYANTGPCYMRYDLTRVDWCDICEGSQPLWEERTRASRRLGPTLRRLMYLCKQEVTHG